MQRNSTLIFVCGVFIGVALKALLPSRTNWEDMCRSTVQMAELQRRECMVTVAACSKDLQECTDIIRSVSDSLREAQPGQPAEPDGLHPPMPLNGDVRW